LEDGEGGTGEGVGFVYEDAGLIVDPLKSEWPRAEMFGISEKSGSGEVRNWSPLQKNGISSVA
jgi:hypothetical protein